MAIRNLEVVITVTDKASKDLDKISKKVKDVGNSAKSSTVDFTGFNRSLFAAGAYMATFFKTFSTLGKSFEEGANLDRLTNQFERVLGPRSQLSAMVGKFTDSFVDEFAAMKEGIALKSMGIVRGVDQVAEIFSQASVAAKQAGKESGEGIKSYSDFLKDGNVSHLQFLNLIAQSNPALQAQMAILGKVGGVMSNVISTQARLSLGSRLMYLATKDAMKGGRDLTDTLKFFGLQVTYLRGEVGRLLLTAMQPIIESFALFISRVVTTIDKIRSTEPHIVFLTKVVILATGAILSFVGALGTLRIAAIALQSLGFGLPRLIFLVLSLGSAFLGITNQAKGVIDKLRLIGAFIKGVYQLVTSLSSKTGIAYIDEDIRKLLEDNGIWEFTKQVSRGVAVVKTVVMDLVHGFEWLSKKTDDIFGGIGKKFIDLIAKMSHPWKNFWVSESATPMQTFIRNFAVIGGSIATIFTALLTKSLLGKAGNMLSKIPGLGFLGGAQKSGPNGTKSNPIFVKSADSIANGMSGMLGKAGASILTTVGGFLPGPIKAVLELFSQTLGQSGFIAALKEIPTLFGLLSESVGGVFAAFRMIAGVVSTIISAFVVFGSALYGAVEGIMLTADEYGKFFQGIFDLTKAIGGIVFDWLGIGQKTGAIGKALDTGLLFFKEVVIGTMMDIVKNIAEGFKILLGTFGIQLGSWGTSLSKFSKQLNPNAFPEDKENLKIGQKLLQNAILPSVSDRKTNISIPADKATSAEATDSIGELLKTLSGEQRKQVESAYENAISATSPGGAGITAEEYATIQKMAQKPELGYLSRIADGIESLKDKTVSGPRGN